MALEALTEGLKRLRLEDVPRLAFFQFWRGGVSAAEAERLVRAGDGLLIARPSD